MTRPSAGDTTIPGRLGITRSGSRKKPAMQNVATRAAKVSAVNPKWASTKVTNPAPNRRGYPAVAIGSAHRLGGSDQIKSSMVLRLGGPISCLWQKKFILIRHVFAFVNKCSILDPAMAAGG
jgi:hypothetical protein